MLCKHPHSSLRNVIRPVMLRIYAAVFLVACNGGENPIAPNIELPAAPRVHGRVVNPANGNPVPGAQVTIGAATFTTRADGRFSLTGLTAGAATLRCKATGFVDFEMEITVSSENGLTYDIALTRMEVFEFERFALYVPAGVTAIRGLIIALGGPDTRGFATGKPMGAPIPAVEASLQTLGQDFRTLAAKRGLAILGTSRAAMPNSAESDRLLSDAVTTAATMSGRSDLPNAALIIYGMSGGAPQASGYTVRHHGFVAGLFLKVPTTAPSVTSGNVLGVPTYVVLAELDANVNNAALTAAFEGSRGAGELWALAVEPGVPHHSLSAVQREVTLNWISTIIDKRQPFDWYLPEIAETSGWLGNRVTGAASPYASYSGDRALASWLPSESAAKDWEKLVAR